MRISARVDEIQQPIIPYIAQLIKNNPGTINFGQGIVNYLPPKVINEAVASFFADPLNHRYKAVDGLPDLQNALRHKLNQENGINTALPWSLFITAGSNMAFFQAILAITDPGDEVIQLSPFYFNHEMAIRLANAKPVIVATDSHYQPVVDNIRLAITPKTRAIVTISPNNPTGAVYPQDTLQQISRLCAEHKIYHIHDEAYEYFIHDDVQHYSPASDDSAYPHTLSLFSFSKTYAMASWRIGYLLAPDHLDGALRKIQDTNLICAPVISQIAARSALQSGKQYCLKHLNDITKHRDLIKSELDKHKQILSYALPNGAFYFYLKIPTRADSIELARFLIEEHKVAIIPGKTFGDESHCCARIAFGALTTPEIKEGINRLAAGITQFLS